jgi:hypothetical protein
MDKPEISPDIARTFAAFLAMVEDGRLAADLSDGLSELVGELHNAAREGNGKAKGQITIALGFKLEGGVIEVAGDCKIAKPKAPRSRSIFWATPENNLTRQNPRQGNLFPRDVTGPAAAGEVRTV